MIALERKPVHPGEVLREDFLKPYRLTAPQLAHYLHVSPATIRKILREQARLTPNLALRLARLFGTSADVWLGLQNECDLYREQQTLQQEIYRIQPLQSVNG